MSDPHPAANTVPLADVPGTIPALAQWFVDEWEPYYGATGPGDALADLEASHDDGMLPIAVVALDEKTLSCRGPLTVYRRNLAPA